MSIEIICHAKRCVYNDHGICGVPHLIQISQRGRCRSYHKTVHEKFLRPDPFSAEGLQLVVKCAHRCGGSLSIRDAQRHMRIVREAQGGARAVLQAAVDAGLGTWQARPRKLSPRGGRTLVHFVANGCWAPWVPHDERVAVKPAVIASVPQGHIELKLAKEWLASMLARGPMPTGECIRLGAEQGHSERTLRRAFEGIGGRPRKIGMRGGWTWELRGFESPAALPGTAQKLDLMSRRAELGLPIFGDGDPLTDYAREMTAAMSD